MSAQAAAFIGRLGVRGRAITTFGLMALVLSGLMAVTVWYSVSNYLLELRQDSATAQVATHVEQLRTTLGTRGTAPTQEFAKLPRTIQSVSLLLVEANAGDRWFTSSLTIDSKALPSRFLERVSEGGAVRQRVMVGGDPVLAVGVPVPELGAAYFEVFPLVELEQTFRVLGGMLVAGVVLVPAGTVLLGRWSLGPALRPLDRIAAVSRAVAAGDLAARLDPAGDPALVPIAASFNETADALERRVRVDAQFAADVSHELRSPLTAILGAVNVLGAQRSDLSPLGAEMVSLLEVEVGRFARLVEDLLEISRIDAGSAELELDDVRLADLVRHSVDQGRHDRVVVTDAGSNVVVTVDKRRMERVVANLVDNADRHGRGLHRVLVDATADVGVVAVEDRGDGLAADQRDRVFERFARSRSSARDSTTGAGLGLSLVARHLQLMGGTVAVQNVPGGGARFTVTVPSANRT